MPNILRAFLLVALLVSSCVLALSWNLPILEMHSFRQTQTAISVYWMASSPDWLAYPTPVLGFPWSIPFELPLFQAIVLAAASILPVNLDQAGRLVSWLFALATLWPLRLCVLEASGGNRRLAGICCVLFLLSPLYLFWSRAFLIESTALFFSVSFVALVFAWLRTQKAWIAVLMIACAVLAALVKITTFFGFAIAGAMVLLAHLLRTRGDWSLRSWLRLYTPAAVAVCAAIALTAMWVHFSDVQKARTVWGSAIGSANLGLWNFGSMSQRLGGDLWSDVIFGRAARDILGAAWLFPLAALAALALRGNRILALCALALFLLPFMVFTNLHMVHNYYQYANAVCLVVLLGCALEGVCAAAGERAGMAALALCAVLMLLGFRRDFLPAITGPLPATPTLAVAAHARAHTPPDSVLLAFGLDWSAEMPYYATRRALLVPDWVPADTLRRIRLDPASYTGGLPLGMVVVCPNKMQAQAATRDEYRLLMAGVRERMQGRLVAGCTLYR